MRPLSTDNPHKNTLVRPLSPLTHLTGPYRTRPHYRAVSSEANVHIQSHHTIITFPLITQLCYHPVSVGFASEECWFFSLLEAKLSHPHFGSGRPCSEGRMWDVYSSRSVYEVYRTGYDYLARHD